MPNPYAFVVYKDNASARVLLYNYDENGFERCTNAVQSSVDRSVVKNGRRIVRLDVFSSTEETENENAN